MNVNRSDRVLELVSAAYGAAIEPERFDDLLEAWDRWCEEFIDVEEVAFQTISPQFEDALAASERLGDKQPRVSAIETTQAPLIVVDADNLVIAVNAAASGMIARGEVDPEHLIRSRRSSKQNFGADEIGAYRCQGRKDGENYLTVEAPVTAAIKVQNPKAETMIMLSLLEWDDAFSDQLKVRFNLSDAELRVARGLLEGRTAQEISATLNRSLATVRSHIKALLTKSGARRQTEFVQLLTILRQVGRKANSAPEAEHQTSDFRTEAWSEPAGTLRVVRYGTGRPAIYFTTSSLPEETKAVREAFADAGLSIIAPARPGFRGEATRADQDASIALVEGWTDRLIKEAGPGALFIGHREGGILAAKAAQAVLARGGSVGALILISTGAPTRDIAEFDDSPETIKRSFRAARFAKAGLTLGYHTAARVFRSGSYGQDKILEYFFRDSPVDAKLMSDANFREAMLANLDYCFRHPSQIARDVGDWGSDWSAALDDVAASATVHFIHGDAHSFLLPSRVMDLAAQKSAVSATLLDGSGQLALYERTKAISNVLSGFV